MLLVSIPTATYMAHIATLQNMVSALPCSVRTNTLTLSAAAHSEFAFHVTTMVPVNVNAPEEDFTERQRLLENDICIIIFSDATKTSIVPAEFKAPPNRTHARVSFHRSTPSDVVCLFSDVLFVVQVDRSRSDGVYYKYASHALAVSSEEEDHLTSFNRVNIAYRDGVTVPSPPLQEPPVFLRGLDFKNWLLLKSTIDTLRYIKCKWFLTLLLFAVINAERGAYASPHFLKPIQNMRQILIEELVTTYASAAQNLLS